MEFNQLINEKELYDLTIRYPAFQITEHRLEVSQSTYNYYYEILQERRERRGEVVLAIEDDQRRLLFHTKDFYPAKVYRLPTGGIYIQESVVDAVYRESFEETGLTLAVKNLLGIVKIKFCHQQNYVPFVSYIFHLSSNGLDPQPTDKDENIADFRWLPIDYLPDIIAILRSQQGHWHDWGRFRAIPHQVIFKKFNSQNNKLGTNENESKLEK